jgi:hypothetical protein
MLGLTLLGMVRRGETWFGAVRLNKARFSMVAASVNVRG